MKKEKKYLTFVVDADNDYEPISSAEIFKTSDIEAYLKKQKKEFEPNEDGDHILLLDPLGGKYQVFMSMTKRKFKDLLPEGVNVKPEKVSKKDMRELFDLYSVFSTPLGD